MSESLDQPIETDRLSLGSVSPSDAEDLFAIMHDPALGEFTGEAPPESVAAMKARIEAWVRGPDPWSDERWLNWLARTHEGRPVALLSATIQRSSTWLAWIVAVQSQRRGYATEAARAIMAHLAANGIAAFAASIPGDHEASEGVARNLGFLLTDEVVHGERVWRMQMERRSPSPLRDD